MLSSDWAWSRLYQDFAAREVQDGPRRPAARSPVTAHNGSRDRTRTDIPTPQKIHPTKTILTRGSSPHAPRVATVPPRLPATHPQLASHRRNRNNRLSPSTQATPPTCGTVPQVPLGRDSGGPSRQREREGNGSPVTARVSFSFLGRHNTTPSGQVHSPARLERTSDESSRLARRLLPPGDPEP